MPRASDGTYTKPNPDVVSGFTISSPEYNSTNDDIATELTDSLSRSGKGGMSAELVTTGVNSSGPISGTTGTFSGALTGLVTATGSTQASSLADRAAVVRNIKLDHGAAVNGTTNDNAAVIAADAAAAAAGGGGVVFFPEGTTIVTNGLPSSGVEWRGVPGKSIIKRANGSNSGHVIDINAKNGVTLRDLIIDGNKAQNTGTLFGIHIDSCHDIRLDNVKAINCNSHGIDLRNSADEANDTRTRFVECESSANDGVGLSVLDCHNVSVCGGVYKSNSLQGINVFGSVQGTPSSEYIDILGVRALKNGRSGIQIDGIAPASAQYEVAHFAITGCLAVANQQGFVIQGRQGTVTGNISRQNVGPSTNEGAGFLINSFSVVLSGNMSTANDARGIDLGFSRNVVCTGNIVRNNGALGIELNNTIRSVVNGNAVFNNNMQTVIGSEDRAGILIHNLAGQTDANIISGNLVRAESGNQKYGIYAHNEAAGSLAKNMILHNQLQVGSDSAVTGHADIKINTGSTQIKVDGNYTGPIEPNGVAIAAAADLEIPDDGNTFRINGSGDVNNINYEGGSRQRGRVLYLVALTVFTLKDGVGNMQLAGDFVTAANRVITLVDDGTNWQEVSRSTN